MSGFGDPPPESDLARQQREENAFNWTIIALMIAGAVLILGCGCLGTIVGIVVDA